MLLLPILKVLSTAVMVLSPVVVIIVMLMVVAAVARPMLVIQGSNLHFLQVLLHCPLG